MKMMKAAVALGMALTMTVTGASAVFAEGETLSVATDFEVKTLVPWAASDIFYLFFLEKAEFVQNKYIIRTKPILNNKKQ